MDEIRLPDGTSLASIGLGTWRLGESPGQRDRDIAAVRDAIDLGYRVIDTAEMYGEGGAEEVVGAAVEASVRSRGVGREELFIVSKIYPHNASRRGVQSAVDRSRRRLKIDRIDLYLLHWPGPYPLVETVAAFEAARSNGLIGQWGVSNFDLDELEALRRTPDGAACAANQVYYSASTRGVEFDLLPRQREWKMPLMAYCPLDQGELAKDEVLRQIARRHGATPSQVGLAWLMAQDNVMAIPKAVKPDHLRDNLAASRLRLDPEDFALIEQRFPRPRHKVPLAMR